LGECVGYKARGKYAELQETKFMIVSCWVLNDNDNIPSQIQLQAMYTAVRLRKELIDLSDTQEARQSYTFYHR
jgi:hypothetical protein